MEINNEVIKVLAKHNIDKDLGLLALLAIHFELDVELLVPDNVIKAINITKILEKDYEVGNTNWNIPLFTGGVTAFDWVEDWMKPFGTMNPERRGVKKDCISRMKRFFSSNPEYRKDDVYAARDLYLSTIKDSKFLKSPHKFIYEGAGDFRNSSLLQWCEQVAENKSTKTQTIKGLIK